MFRGLRPKPYPGVVGARLCARAAAGVGHRLCRFYAPPPLGASGGSALQSCAGYPLALSGFAVRPALQASSALPILPPSPPRCTLGLSLPVFSADFLCMNSPFGVSLFVLWGLVLANSVGLDDPFVWGGLWAMLFINLQRARWD